MHALARRAGHVIAVEIDARLAERLRSTARPNVEVVTGDFLDLPAPSGPHKIFANLPFARTAEMVVRLTGTPALTDAYLIVQREAAERFAGYPYNSETVRSLSLKPWRHAEILRRLRRTDFEPVPRVDAVLLWLMRRDRPLLREAEGTATCGSSRANWAPQHGAGVTP